MVFHFAEYTMKVHPMKNDETCLRAIYCGQLTMQLINVDGATYYAAVETGKIHLRVNCSVETLLRHLKEYCLRENNIKITFDAR